ncbi:MAG TPA: glycoside hydrolase domain-containing protein [Aeromicrobium sp.]|nr:glycoside hydrolase domain-containing protein [Aeromicrobium sp.]
MTSPTSRVVGILVAASAAVFALASPASAAPQAPGDFTGLGFDTCSAPNMATMNAWGLISPFSAVGIYISGNSRYCGDAYQPNLTKDWVAANSRNGWRFIPIHVGYQSPCFKNNPQSRVQKKKMSSDPGKARQQARSDAAETIAALRRLGFPRGSASYLDLEWYKRTSSCDNAVLEFMDAWTETLRANGYKSGVYSSGSAGIKVLNDALAARRANFTAPDHVWFAWTNGVANTDAGPYLSSAYFSRHQRLHQYSNGKAASYGGAKITIDWNVVDTGRGSVRTPEPKPCKVAMTFSSYPRLKVGDERPEVAALQCLLKQRGYDVSPDGSFGRGTAAALDKFRASLGWGPSGGHTTSETWTALLSAGRRPGVLKRGSVGDPVWRLQRALRAAGAKVPVNGLYDSGTVAAVKQYRAARGLPGYETTEWRVWRELFRGRDMD